MSGWAIEVRPAPDVREAVAARLVTATGQAIEERDDGTLVGWAETEAGAQQVRSAMSEVRGVAATVRPLPDIDWTTEWKKGLAPRTIGRVIVTPSWIPQAPGEGQVVVTVDPETAFGSGEHGSTRGALLLLDRAIAARTTQHSAPSTQHSAPSTQHPA
ncbi:MAG TPA: 50S ribosomal protein L11 methyltransferase, partial [Gemmatimonadales bacterium]|nr:50S ribosomal protein L11 methyltransferase [Gemmatimonadales bacterium]